MKKLVFLFVSIFVLVVAAQNVKAQDEATVSDASASAKIISKIALTLENSGLNFGTLVPTATAGTVIITPAGERPISENVDYIDQADNIQAALFKATGEVGYTFSITLPTTDDTNPIQLSSGGNNMDVHTFTSSIPLIDNSIVTGGNSFTVGATLEVGVNQAAGNYSGSFPVTVAYQ